MASLRGCGTPCGQPIYDADDGGECRYNGCSKCQLCSTTKLRAEHFFQLSKLRSMHGAFKVIGAIISAGNHKRARQRPLSPMRIGVLVNKYTI